MTLAIRLFKYISVVKWQFAFGMLLLLLAIFSLQFSPIILQHIIDSILTPVANGNSLNTPLLVQYSLLLLSVVITSSLFNYFSIRVLMNCSNTIGEYLRNKAYETMQKLPISYFDSEPAGKIATRIVNDTETLRYQFYSNVITQLLNNVVMVIVIYGMLFALNITLGLFLLLLMPLIFIWHNLYGKVAKKHLETYYESQSSINTQVNETMNGSTILQLFKQENDMINEFDHITLTMYRAQQKLIINDSFFSWTLMNFFKQTVLFLIIAIIGHNILSGVFTITTGILFATISYSERLFNTIMGFVRLLPNVQRAMTTGSRVFELLDAPIEDDNSNKLVIKNGNVSFKNVSFGYKDNHLVLKNINITAKKGEVIALVGHTGSGKSSIINLLFRFYDPQSGVIEIDGQNIKQFNRESVRKDMGIVLQDSYLFSGTIASNISMEDTSITEEKIKNALVAVGAKFMLSKYEKGIYEPVSQKGNTFSSGERQLISFARTLANDPKILILDEATSHIDTETEDIIQQAMKVVQQGRTTFIIAHRLSTIQHANQIIVLHEGQIVEQGTHDDLLKLNQQYAQMYRMQSNMN